MIVGIAPELSFGGQAFLTWLSPQESLRESVTRAGIADVPSIQYVHGGLSGIYLGGDSILVGQCLLSSTRSIAFEPIEPLAFRPLEWKRENYFAVSAVADNECLEAYRQIGALVNSAALAVSTPQNISGVQLTPGASYMSGFFSVQDFAELEAQLAKGFAAAWSRSSVIGGGLRGGHAWAPPSFLNDLLVNALDAAIVASRPESPDPTPSRVAVQRLVFSLALLAVQARFTRARLARRSPLFAWRAADCARDRAFSFAFQIGNPPPAWVCSCGVINDKHSPSNIYLQREHNAAVRASPRRSSVPYRTRQGCTSPRSTGSSVASSTAAQRVRIRRRQGNRPNHSLGQLSGPIRPQNPWQMVHNLRVGAGRGGDRHPARATVGEQWR